MMKHLLVWTAVALMTLSMTACGTGTSSSAAGSSGSASPAASSSQAPSSSSASAGTAGTIAREDALAAALTAAGLTEEDLIGWEAREDRDDGLVYYEVDLYTSTADYEFEVGTDGAILSQEQKSYDMSWTTPEGAAVTKEAAMASALERVSGATESNLRMWVERDDGFQCYEGEIIYNGTKAEFSIDLQTGEFLEWSEKALTAGSSASGDTGAAASSQAVQASAPAAASSSSAAASSSSAAAGGTVTEDQAKAAALSAAGIQESDLIGFTVRPERDDGRQTYQVDLYTASADYEIDVDMTTGQVLGQEQERYDMSWTTPDGASVTKEAAIQSVLERVSGATEANLRMQVERDDGRTLYEGSVIYNGKDYDFEIDVQTGEFISWSEEAL
ncbi:MAG TPA: PepSY domain-containing protein [Firmicutes bacterium]|nr:PepSY domain-containing protein [Bacillota bacterium]